MRQHIDEDYLKYDYNLKNEDDLKNRDDLKTEEDLRIEVEFGDQVVGGHGAKIIYFGAHTVPELPPL